jgi:hypothetical protein
MQQFYWPEESPREETIEAFVNAYKTLGYQVAADPNQEAGLEKVAIYARNGSPTHAARQLDNGSWTSKLGANIDVEHTLRGLAGPEYGDLAVILCRLRTVV